MFNNKRTNPKIFLNFLAGVALPLAQAVISGVFLGFTAYSIARWFGYQRPSDLGLLVAAIAAVLAWFAALRWWRIGLGVESKDISNKTKEHTVRVEIASNKGRTLQFANLPATPEQLRVLAEGLTNGRSFTEAAWVGSYHPFTRAEFVDLREELIARKLAAWNNPICPARGVSLTKAGEAVMRYIANERPTPDIDNGPGSRVYA